MANLPTVKQLRYLLELHKALHFRKAADACFVTQSAFSSAIKELESNLDAQLVDRSNRSVVFTAIGNKVVDRARLILDDLNGIAEISNVANKPLGGELNLGIIPSIAPFVITRIIPDIQESYPDLDIGVTENQTAIIHQQLLEGELDLLLLALPYDLLNTETLELCDDPFSLAFRSGTKLIDNKRANFDELQSNSILLLDDGHCMREHALSACSKKNRERISRFSCNSLFSLVQIVGSDLGVTYLPQLAIDGGILEGTNVEAHALKSKASRKIGLAWRNSSGRADEFREIAKILQASLKR